jgi:hypothetical protein
VINPCGEVMDYIRSCYSTQMRFRTGDTPVSVAWYFCPTGAKKFSSRHRYASLNNARGLYVDDGSIGEVPGAARPWRNGSEPAAYDGQRIAGTASDFDTGSPTGSTLSWAGTPEMPIACMLTPPPPCFTPQLANYNTVEMSFDGGVTWLSASPVGGDHWQYSYTVGGRNFLVDTFCGGLVSGSMSLEISPTTPISTAGVYPTYAFSSTYPPKWTFRTVAGNPANWTGGDTWVRISVQPKTRQTVSNVATQATSISCTLPAASIAGNSLALFFLQHGNDASGGILANPTTPSGWTLYATSTDKRLSAWYRLNAPSTTAISVASNGAGDLQQIFAAELATLPGAGLQGNNHTFGGAATLTPSMPSCSDGGRLSNFIGMIAQFRSALVTQAAATFSAPTGGFAIANTRAQGPFSGSPTFEGQTGGLMTLSPTSTGSHSGQVTSTRSLAFNSILLAIS